MICLRQVHDFVESLSRTLLQSRRNGIWAYAWLHGDNTWEWTGITVVQSEISTGGLVSLPLPPLLPLLGVGGGGITLRLNQMGKVEKPLG